jgi:pantothenate kinase
MSRYIYFQISESGFDYTVKYTERTIEKYFLPFIDGLEAEFVKRGRTTYLLAIAGPPGCGKSTIASILQQLLKERGVTSLILPLDGFHLRNEELKERSVTLQNRTYSLYEIKGAKETYNVDQLIEAMKKLKAEECFSWPIYLRTVHDPVEEGIYLSEWNTIYIIEGNYLFLDIPPWKSLRYFFDKTLFIVPRSRFLKQRITRRKRRGGYTRKQTLAHYYRSDLRNIQEVLSRSSGYDHEIKQRGRHSYIFKNCTG